MLPKCNLCECYSITQLNSSVAHFIVPKNFIDLLRKYAAVLVLLAAAHVYTLADIAAIIWQQLQYSRLHRVRSSETCFKSH